MLENLYGAIPEETTFIAHALKEASRRQTAHPDDRPGWSPVNPTYGHCDIYTDYVRQIWGKDEYGHWNTEAKILVWWVYKNLKSFSEGRRKNKLTVHYNFKHPEYGMIDLSHNQFPNGTFLYQRPEPLGYIVPVDKKWHPSSQMRQRKELFEKAFIESLLSLPKPKKITPELKRFLDGVK